MSSNRPETSQPRSSTVPPIELTEKSLPVIASDIYAPRASHLVISLPRIGDNNIPQSLLESEAVDSSLLLGNGASFTVTRQALPPGPKVMVDRIEFGKLMTLELPFKVPKRRDYIVYKSPRVAFGADGEPASPQDRRALQSVLTELHALLHPPLRRHANIITIIGVAWGSSHEYLFQRLPVLVVEYGDKGTLADVQIGKDPLPNDLKVQIALGIASGLKALHSHDMVHGDMKPENIIMFSDPQKTLVPKLGDFGFAVIEAAEATDVMLGGTRTWRAPESYSRLPISMLRFTDVYSFGLVAWSIALDGMDPFGLLLPEHLQSEARSLAIDQLKADDNVFSLLAYEEWILEWEHSKKTRRSTTSSSELVGKGTETSTSLQVGPDSTTVLCATLRQLPYYRSLECVLASTLSLHPKQRDLTMAIDALNSDSDADLAQDIANLNLSERHPQSQNLTISIENARIHDAQRPYTEVPYHDPSDDSPGTPSPSVIMLEECPGKSVQDLGSELVPGIPVAVVKASSEDDDSSRHWSTVYFEVQPRKATNGINLLGRPYASYFQLQEGTGLRFRIPKREGRDAFRITHSQGENSRTWIVRFNEEPNQQTIPARQLEDRPAQAINWGDLGYKQEIHSFLNTRDLDPSIQRFLVGTLAHRTDGGAIITLSACIMNGYGVIPDTQAALHVLVEAVRKNHPVACAYAYRVFTACGEKLPPDLPIVALLEHMAVNGSRMALIDLATINVDAAERIRIRLRNELCSIGVVWYYHGQWLHDLSLAKLRDENFSVTGLGTPSEMRDFIVNLRGDGLIHAAAATCAYKLLRELLQDHRFDVDQRNRHGETALLCATRAGHPAIVKLLLSHGARASLQANNGETPLHWLLSFTESEIPAIGKALIDQGGANIDALTNRYVSHSSFSSQMDVDVQITGTPLLWAVWHDRLEVVSFLLSVGADPQLSVPMHDNGESPLNWAAGLHHAACLQLLISHLEAQSASNQEPPPKPILYGPIVKLAIHTSDKFSMIIRHGARYLEQIGSTLRFLHQKTKNIRMLTIKNSYDTAIGFAASQAHDEAVEVLLKLGWGIEDINHPNRENGRTPLLDAVRWNRRHLMQLLLRHGADPLAKAWNPFDQTKSDWSALHIFAEQAHDDNLTVINDLLEAGHPVDGRDDEDEETDTPLSVAIRRNAFHLASHLLSNGADINALSTRSSLLVSSYPLTPLGHIIALNARHCLPSLRWLLSPHSAVTPDTVNFIVEPTRYLTALHLCAIVPQDLRYTSGAPLSARDFDFETNRRIVHELLEWFAESEFLDERCGVDEKTALHLAAECGNVGVVEELVRAGADVAVRDRRGETAVEVARRVFVDDEKVLGVLLEWLG